VINNLYEFIEIQPLFIKLSTFWQIVAFLVHVAMHYDTLLHPNSWPSPNPDFWPY